MKHVKKIWKDYRLLIVFILIVAALVFTIYEQSPAVREKMEEAFGYEKTPTTVSTTQPSLGNIEIISGNQGETETLKPVGIEGFDYTQVPEYKGMPYVVVNDNKASFTDEELSEKTAWQAFSNLDALGRVGPAEAVIHKGSMPKKPRESISSVKPSGWKNVKYDIVESGWVYNRCHLIGFQLTGENANPKNLMTGTRAFNVQGMLPFENQIADYIKTPGNYVRYKVTPVFVGEELVARGLYMEAKSIGADDLEFFVYAFNEQPGIKINFADGTTHKIE